mmetsp:Transcript_23249/g.51018  ORF Transcript_23249/g.51018 Transcript_23249/m.51018 type:complete len:80 (+) Transcript_23249:101-340(+)
MQQQQKHSKIKVWPLQEDDSARPGDDQLEAELKKNRMECCMLELFEKPKHKHMPPTADGDQCVYTTMPFKASLHGEKLA